jgi:putative tricarboxylic transport membrane protein
MLENIYLGLGTIANWSSLFAIVGGVCIGILAGVMPGLSASTAVALLVPFTYGMSPIVSMLLLVSVYMAGEYGGSISSIAIGTPGTPAAAATLFDGYQLTLKGQPGKALGTSVVASTAGGMFGALMLLAFSESLARVALSFGAPEYCSLAIFGLTIIASMAGDNLLKGFIVMLFGLLIRTIGLDPFTGAERFVFGVDKLMEGVGLIPALIGLFALAQVFVGIEELGKKISKKAEYSYGLPTLRELRKLWKVILQSSVIGSLIGVLPGAGATIASFICYNEAKRFSKTPESFGTGCLEGVAAPEAGNNAVVGGALIPLLTLGIPGSATAAVLIGALMLHGLLPGPMLFVNNADLVYGVFVGLFVACIFQLIFGLIGIPLWVKIIATPKGLLLPVIGAISIVGAYGKDYSMVDVWVMFFFGVMGYLLKKFNYPVTPVILALVLGGILEENFRRALMLSDGSYAIFFSKPISLALLIMAVLSLGSPLLIKKFTRVPAKTEKN